MLSQLMKCVAYDLFPGDRQIRPHAPSSLRFIPWLLYLTVLGTVGVVSMNALRIVRSRTRAEEMVKQTDKVKQDCDQLVAELAADSRRRDMADDIRDWLEMSPSDYDLLLQIDEELARSRVTVRNLSLSRAEGQPLLNYVIVFSLTDKKESLKAVLESADEISARFGAAGYKTVGLPTSIQDTPNTWKVGQTLSVPLKSRAKGKL